MPYGVNKSNLVEQIAQIVIDRKMPLLLDVSDFSTDEVRIDLTLKHDADEAKVLAYLYKHTALQTNFNVNLTCLIPTENPEVGAPAKLGLKEILWHFLHFRLNVVTRRLENELAGLEKRIHILQGFALIFDALDEIIKIIRASDGKADAAAKIMAGSISSTPTRPTPSSNSSSTAWPSSKSTSSPTNSKKKQKRAREIKKLLNDDTSDPATSGRWGIVREEIEDIIAQHGKTPAAKRRTTIEAVTDEPEYAAEDFIVAEDCHVLVTADGWVKRQKEIKEPGKSRIREGDRVLACVAGSTRATLGFFSSLGTCYTARFIDLPASTGHGEPIQKLFKLKDGERIVAALSFDPRTLEHGDEELLENPKKPEQCPWTHGFAATTDGYALRFGIAGFAEPSTRSGRRYARPAKGQSVVGFTPIHGQRDHPRGLRRLPRHGLPRRRSQLPLGPRQGRATHQTRPARQTFRLQSKRRRPRPAHRRNQPRGPENHQHREVPHHRPRRPRHRNPKERQDRPHHPRRCPRPAGSRKLITMSSISTPRRPDAKTPSKAQNHFCLGLNIRSATRYRRDRLTKNNRVLAPFQMPSLASWRLCVLAFFPIPDQAP